METLGLVGYHIGLLVMAALRYLCPDFLKENRLYWLRSPLYTIEGAKQNYYYYTDEEFNQAKKPRGNIDRAKGLGALDAMSAKESMFGVNQHMDVIEVNEESLQMLEDLMGVDVEPRRNYIFNNVDFSEIRE